MNKSSVLKKTGIALAVTSAVVFKPTYAATFNVDSTVDQPSVCTFEAAIAALHEETPTGMASCSNTSNLELGINDQITFDNIALITGINSQFEITRSVQINPGGSRVRFVGTDESRIFQISNENPVDEDDDQDEDDNDIEVNVTIDNVELTRGRANSNDESGGAILVRDADTFTLINSVVAGNMVTGNNNSGGGAIAIFGSDFTMRNSTIENNQSSLVGGGIAITGSTEVTIANSTFSNNNASQFGGGIHLFESKVIDISNSLFSNNSAENSGGGISIRDSATDISDTTFSNNSANNNGGAIHVENSARLEQSDCTGRCVSLISNRIIDNSSSRGGGISIVNGNSTEIRNTLISRNETSIHGESVFGGGVFVDDMAFASIIGSTISENTSGLGAGIAVQGGAVELINSTVSGNIASDKGAGIMAETNTGARVSLFHSTITNNASTGEGTGIYSVGSNTLIEIFNSVIAGNTRLTNDFGTFQGVEINANNVTSGGVNVFGDNSISNDQAFRGFTPSLTDITATLDGSQETPIENILNPLADNGGDTPTHSLAEQSPAIDRADMGFCDLQSLAGVDQTGKNRPIGPACDIGAFENEDTSSLFVIPLPNGKAVIFEL